MREDHPSRRSLWSHSAQFWLGAFMVAEAPFTLAVMMLPETARRALLDWGFSGALPLLLSIGMLVLSGLLVGITAHRLGWGD